MFSDLKRRNILLVLLIVLVISLCSGIGISLTAKAESGTSGLSYTLLSDDTYSVTGYTGSSTTVTIPATYNGKAVTRVGTKAFYQNTTIKTVNFEEGSNVETISNDAFTACYSLTTVTIPDSVTTIRYNAFCSCESLKNITIPDSVTTIEHGAFQSCKKLTSITIPASVTDLGYGAFLDCYALTSVTINCGTNLNIGERAFSGCTALTSVTIDEPNGWYVSTSSTASSGTDLSSSDLSNASTVATYFTSTYYNYYWYFDIGTLAYSQNSSGYYSVTGIGTYKSTNLVIPDTYGGVKVTQIGDEAFRDNKDITSVSMSDNVTTISDYAFWGCTSIKTVVIGDEVTSIGKYTFNGCKKFIVLH